MPTTIQKLESLYETLDAEMREAKAGASDDILSLESIADSPVLDTQYSNLKTHLSNAATEIGHLLDDETLSMEASDESVKAGVMAYLASSNPREYMRALRKQPTDAVSLESLYTGPGGELETMDFDTYSQESFDENNISGLATHNAIVNMLASRQEPAMEALFPTKVYAATDTGINLSVDQQEVIREVRHPNNGQKIELDRKRLLRGFIDHTILAGSTIDLIPWANPTGEADDNFVDPAIIANKTIKYDKEVAVPTRPLAINKEFNLLGLSQHPGVTKNNQLDISDQIAYGVKLTNLYLAIKDGAAAEAFRFPVSQLSRNDFIKSTQGKGRSTTLNFMTNDLLIDSTITDIAGVVPTDLKADIIDPDLVVRLKVSVTGHMDLNLGDTEVNASPVTVSEVIDDQGNKIDLKAGQGLAVVNLLQTLNIRVIGYDLDAKASNSNWRFDGPLIDVTPHNEIYLIPPGSPITVITPPLEQQNGRKIQGMANAVKIVTTNNAVTTMLNYFGELLTYRDAASRGIDVRLHGIARYLVDVYANYIPIDVADRVKNIESHERHESVTSVLVYQLRTEAWNMYRDSNYGSAMKVQTGNSTEKPHVVIVTDSIIARHLNTVKGEAQIERMLGDRMTCEVHIIDDLRIKGKIYMTFGRGRPGVEDLLGFGVHAYVPELSQQLTVDRQGATRTINRMIPRNFHLPILPIMVCFEINNLEEALNATAP